MPELHFKGKEYVYNHHLTVPYRPLEAHPDKSIGDESENLIIHGDNLHALKALLPRYAGKVDCIFIDPPYNTGNENWNYNDKVNSPIMQEWLDGNPVNKEDMLRHDKWCCLMYPRLKLLHELLSENGSFWMTLDDNEVHRARMILDEIFGEDNHLCTFVWQKRYGPPPDTKDIGYTHDCMHAYRKTDAFERNLLPLTEDQVSRYQNPDNDPMGRWKAMDYTCRYTRKERPNLYYPIIHPKTGEKVWPKEIRVWAFSPKEHEKNVKQGRLWWGLDQSSSVPAKKNYLSGIQQGFMPSSVLSYDLVGHTDEAAKELRQILPGIKFTSKPARLVRFVLSVATNADSIVLDSFAGSATTAHAVLAQNVKDGGNRRFILVECEDYADQLTAERVRRVIEGYEYQGTQKKELLREKITWSNFSRDTAHRKLLDQVQSIENLESDRFDTINKTVKDGELIVTGEKKITEKVEGLGGGFTYYTLGEPLDLDKLLTGDSLPDYAGIGAWLFHTATGEPLDRKGIREDESYLGTSTAFHVWLIYKPNLDFLKSRDAALTLSFAEKISERKDKRHLVFAPGRFVPNRVLLPLGVEYAPLPFALYRFERD